MARKHSRNNLARTQIALLHVAKRDLGLTDDQYRDILFRFGDCESSKQLDQDGFDLIMQYFSALGFKSTWTEKNFGYRRFMASPKQIALIRSLWDQYRGTNEDDQDKSLNKWLSHFHQVSALRFVDEENVRKIIPVLRAMAKRKKFSSKGL